MLSFAVVEFVDEQSCELVPSNWITEDKDECYFPKYTVGFAKLVKNRAQVDSSWEKFKIRVLTFTDSYTDGIKKKRRAEDTSNIDSDEEPCRSKKRRVTREYVQPSLSHQPASKKSRVEQKFNLKPKSLFKLPGEPTTPLNKPVVDSSSQHNFFTPLSQQAGREPDESESLPTAIDDEVIVSNVFQSTNLTKVGPNSPTVEIDSNLPNAVAVIDPSQVTLNSPLIVNVPTLRPNNLFETPSTTAQTPSELGDLTRFQKLVLRHLSTLNEKIDSLYAAIKGSGNVVLPSPIPVSLPVNSEEDLFTLNEWLTLDNNKQILVAKLQLVGGERKTSVVNNILKEIIGPYLNSLMNFTGRKGKKGLEGSPLYDVILDTLRLNPLTSSTPAVYLNKKISKWLTGWKDRDGGRETRRSQTND